MELLIDVAKFISTELQNRGFKNVTKNFVPCTTNGRTYYIYCKKGCATYKFRVSDHGCGDYRASTEINFSNMQDAEKYFYPERFKMVLTNKILCQNTYEMGEANIPQSEPSKIVEKGSVVRFSKSNRPIYKVTVTQYEYVTVRND